MYHDYSYRVYNRNVGEKISENFAEFQTNYPEAGNGEVFDKSSTNFCR